MITADKRQAYQQLFGAQLEDWERILASAKTNFSIGLAAVKQDATDGPATEAAGSEAFRQSLDELQALWDEKWNELQSGLKSVWVDTRLQR